MPMVKGCMTCHSF